MGTNALDVPKPLLQTGREQTLISRLLDDVSTVVTDICVVTAAGGSSLRETLGSHWGGARIHYVTQDEPRGVGHAVCTAGQVVSGPFAVVMADSFFEDPLAPYLAAWRQSRVPGGVLVEKIREAPADPIGLVQICSGRVVQIEKSASAAGYEYRVCGLVMFPPEALEACAEIEPATTGEIEMESLAQSLLDRGDAFEPFYYVGWRRNVNTPRDLAVVRRHARR